jgi:hypothetical protein
MNAEHSITIKTSEPLSPEMAQQWFSCVKKSGPDGVIGSISTDSGKDVRFFKKTVGENICYTVVLTRDIGQEEAMKIAESFNKTSPDGVWEIIWSQPPANDDRHQEIKQESINTLAVESAKFMHNRIVQKKVTEGWRFGQKFSRGEKTSPMLKEWDGLPDYYKEDEYQRFAVLLEVVGKMGLRLVKKKK